MAEHAIHPESISSLNPEEVAEWDAGEKMNVLITDRLPGI